MKSFSIPILLFTAFFNLELVTNASASNMAELKAKTELEEVLKTLLPVQSFIIHVSGTYEMQTEKKLSENEVILQKQGSFETDLPATLPGFETPTKTPDTSVKNPEQSRMVYKFSEKEMLKGMQVQVFFAEQLDPELVNKMKILVLDYLTTHFSGKASAHFNSLPMAALNPHAPPTSTFNPLYMGLGIGLVLLILGTSIWALLLLSRRRKKIQLDEAPLLVSSLKTSTPPIPDESPEEKSQLRQELLSLILQNTEPFPFFYRSLSLEAQLHLQKQLQGPAFATLLENLELASSDTSVTSDLEHTSMAQMIRDFSEFIRIYNWKQSRFFGFVEWAPLEQLVLWSHEQPALTVAVVTRFLSPKKTSQFLASLPDPQRLEVLAQSPMASCLPIEDITRIENQLRQQFTQMMGTMPGLRYERKETHFWSAVMQTSEDQDQILNDLQKTNPDLYSLLAKLRFKLEDIPTLTQDLTHQVLSETNNDQLAKALLRSSPELLQFVLGQLKENRRQLVSSQMTTLHDIPEEQIRTAELELSKRFRKAIR